MELYITSVKDNFKINSLRIILYLQNSYKNDYINYLKEYTKTASNL